MLSFDFAAKLPGTRASEAWPCGYNLVSFMRHWYLHGAHSNLETMALKCTYIGQNGSQNVVEYILMDWEAKVLVYIVNWNFTGFVLAGYLAILVWVWRSDLRFFDDIIVFLNRYLFKFGFHMCGSSSSSMEDPIFFSGWIGDDLLGWLDAGT